MAVLSERKKGDYKKSVAPFSTSVTDSNRLPPHSMDSEQALLACCILEGGQESVNACIETRIQPESFYKPAHQIIFSAILELYSNGIPIDEVILGEKLHSKGQLENIGGFAYINDIINRIDTPAHMPHYLKRVKDLALLRTLIRISSKTIEEAYSTQESLDQFLEQVEQEIFKISESRISDTTKPIKDSVEDAMRLVDQMVENKGKLTGISTGFVDLDKLTSGFHPTEMIVVAARPSMGKTSIAMNIAEPGITNPDVKKRIPTLLFSLEMGADQIAMRLLCSYARVDMQKLKDGFYDSQTKIDLLHASKVLQNAPLWIDDSGFLTILEMRAKARRIHSKQKLGLIVIDYLQLISGTDSRTPREQQIAEISRGIKAMAKELNVPVVVAAQLNRESEKEKRQPRMSDLRESGTIEQDADVVLLLSKQKDFDEEEDRSNPVVLRDLIIAKQRNGPVGLVTLTFNKRITKFENYSAHYDS